MTNTPGPAPEVERPQGNQQMSGSFNDLKPKTATREITPYCEECQNLSDEIGHLAEALTEARSRITELEAGRGLSDERVDRIARALGEHMGREFAAVCPTAAAPSWTDMDKPGRDYLRALARTAIIADEPEAALRAALAEPAPAPEDRT